MRSALFVVSCFISLTCLAGTSNPCGDLKSEQIRLALIASNLANANTTRTPEGGPYRPLQIKFCLNGICNAVRDSRPPVIKYLPDHPDADQNGYVAFPNINRAAEYAAFNTAATKLKLLAKSQVCGSRAVDHSDSILIRYAKGIAGVVEDIFNFDKSHQVVSWGRTDSKGLRTTTNFKPDGDVASYQ